MKVRELIEILEDFDPDAEVGIAYNYGDIGGTIVAKGVATVGERVIRWSEYHRAHRVVSVDDSEESDDKQMVLLSPGYLEEEWAR